MEQKTVYRSVDTLFQNSQCLFIEYHDVLAMPWFTLLTFVNRIKTFRTLFNTNEIVDYDLAGLLEWYLYRKYRNIFKSLGKSENVTDIPDSEYDVILSKAMSISDDIYRVPMGLNFLSILKILLDDSSMVKQIIIYSESDEPMIEETLKTTLTKGGSKIKYVHGTFADIVKTIPQDSTYVLSDIEKINTLVEYDKLKMSCILIPNGLRYNYHEDDPTKLKIDLEELSKTIIFKYSFFDNINISNTRFDNIAINVLNELLNLRDK